MAGRIAGVLVGMLLGVMATPAMAQSLGDVAREEAARRQQVKRSGKVLTNADLPAAAVVAPPEAAGSADAAEAGETAATPAEGETAAGKTEAEGGVKPAAKEGAPAATKAAAPTDDEAGWRARAERVNSALAALNAQVRQLKALSDRLSLESQASNPAIAARAQAERTDLRAQLAIVQEKQAAAQAERDAFVQQARVAGVPPAWIQ